MSYFINYNSLPEKSLFPGIEAKIAHSDVLTCTHVTLKAGAVLPEHQHLHEQWCHVIEGTLTMTINGETVEMTPGITAKIPSNTPHEAVAKTRCIVIDIFNPAREDLK